MNSGFWRTKKQKEQLPHGKNLTGRVALYIETWESRCYFDGIPDVISNKLIASGRVPSFKAIALAILRNDHNCYALGFSEGSSEMFEQILQNEKRKRNAQLWLL